MESYKGFDIVLDPENKEWHIIKGGRFGISHGSSPSLAEAKRCIDKGMIK